MTFRFFLLAIFALAPLSARAADPKPPTSIGVAHIKLSGRSIPWKIA